MYIWAYFDVLQVYNGLFPFIFLRFCSFSWGSMIAILATDTHQTKMRKQKRKQKGNHVRGGGGLWQNMLIPINIQYFSPIFIIFKTNFGFAKFFNVYNFWREREVWKNVCFVHFWQFLSVHMYTDPDPVHISMTPLFIELRLSNLCIDIATGQIKAHQPGSVLPLLCQYINYTASVGSNHCLQAIWTSRNCNQ